jgi:hypothetical protein
MNGSLQNIVANPNINEILYPEMAAVRTRQARSDRVLISLHFSRVQWPLDEHGALQFIAVRIRTINNNNDTFI